MPRTSPAFVLSLLTLHTLLRVYGRQCFCTKPECVNNTCELSDNDFYHEFCEIVVSVTGNKIEVRHYCVVGTFSDNCVSTSTGFYHCCKEEDFCNRCAIPLGLPGIALEQLGQFLDPQCNYTVPNVTISTPPAPTTTSISSTVVTRATPYTPPTHSSRDQSNYANATIAVASITLLCLVTVTLVVLLVWHRRRYARSRNHDQLSTQLNIDETTAVSNGKLP